MRLEQSSCEGYGRGQHSGPLANTLHPEEVRTARPPSTESGESPGQSPGHRGVVQAQCNAPVTTVDSGSKALEFLGLQQDEQVDSSSSGSSSTHPEQNDIPVVIMSSENVPSSINRWIQIKVFFDDVLNLVMEIAGGFRSKSSLMMY
ncbi:uncharacterized protein A4U43_C06F18160 [Asparagus officinalis]|uniref:Uncharacterized protein n=1 Tax=Asparagus officinalis TaxID=4686 RepID=A0A5P1EQ39_ASPOF|nr:uncharacterized protein A4U43_C06F18160 [Asparagus officinalis]